MPSESLETQQPEQVSRNVSEALQGVVPESGNESVDSAIQTLAMSIGDLVDALIKHLPQLSVAVIVLVVTYFAASIVRRITRRITKRMRLRQSLRDLFGQLIHVAVWFLGMMVATGIVFPGFGVSQIVATAGLMSIAVGFAFQDIFENFFAGVLIL